MCSILLTVTTTSSSPQSHHYHDLYKQGHRSCNSLHIRKPRLIYISCSLNQSKEAKVQVNNIDRRNVLFGLGSLCGGVAAASIFNKDLIANASYGPPVQQLPEFGSHPQALNKPLRFLVERPKESDDDEGEEEQDEDGDEAEEILIVDGIEIPNNDPVRFDVYVNKPNGSGEDDSDYGELAGSMVDIAHTRVGRNTPKGSLELGITELIEDIEAEDSDELVVTLVPRMGHVIIGGVRIELNPGS